MKKGEFTKLLRKLDFRGSVTLYDESGKPTTRVDAEEHGRYSVYGLWSCHCSCVASEIGARELEQMMVY